MKRKLLLLMVLITITVGIEATSAKPSMAPADDFCDAMWETCMALRNDAFAYCRDNGGLDCFCEADRIFNNCMRNWNCTGYSEQQMIERGCGPQQ